MGCESERGKGRMKGTRKGKQSEWERKEVERRDKVRRMMGIMVVIWVTFVGRGQEWKEKNERATGMVLWHDN